MWRTSAIPKSKTLARSPPGASGSLTMITLSGLMDSALSIVCTHPPFVGHGSIADRLNRADSWNQGSFAMAPVAARFVIERDLRPKNYSSPSERPPKRKRCKEDSMKESLSTKARIIGILKHAESGRIVTDLCPILGASGTLLLACAKAYLIPLLSAPGSGRAPTARS